MKSKKNYETPAVLWDDVIQAGSVCATSGDNEEFVDNGVVDWFETTQN